MKDLCEIKLQLDENGRLCVLYGTNAKEGQDERDMLAKISDFCLLRCGESLSEEFERANNELN